jgi:hypothetical protein
MLHTFLKKTPEGRHGVRQLAAALTCLPDISCIFEGASKLAHSKGFAFDTNYAALGIPPARMYREAGETPALPDVISLFFLPQAELH